MPGEGSPAPFGRRGERRRPERQRSPEWWRGHRRHDVETEADCLAGDARASRCGRHGRGGAEDAASASRSIRSFEIAHALGAATIVGSFAVAMVYRLLASRAPATPSSQLAHAEPGAIEDEIDEEEPASRDDDALQRRRHRGLEVAHGVLDERRIEIDERRDQAAKWSGVGEPLLLLDQPLITVDILLRAGGLIAHQALAVAGHDRQCPGPIVAR